MHVVVNSVRGIPRTVVKRSEESNGWIVEERM